MNPFIKSINSILLIIIILGLIDFIYVVKKRRSYTRERISFTAFILHFAFTLLSVCNISYFFYLSLTNEVQKLGESTRFECLVYLIVTVGLSIVVLIVGNKRNRWDGLKSTEQYRCEQRKVSTSVFSEAWRYLTYFVKREKFEIYISQKHGQIVPLSPVEEIYVTWKDKAKTLVSLYCLDYEFDSWHDAIKCWVGKNNKTNSFLLLYPSQSTVVEEVLRQLINYAQSQKCDRKFEIIIAFQEDNSNKNLDNWNCYPITSMTESFLLDNLINFTDYKNKIRQRVEKDRLLDSTLTLSEIFVPAYFLGTDKKKSSETLEEFLYNWLEEPTKRQIVLLGEYGQGKSTAALMFTYNVLFNKPQFCKRIPLFIELRGKSPKNLTPLELLGAWASSYRIEPQALMQLHIEGRLILIFEGFDEMELVGDFETVLKNFRSLWQFYHPKGKILLTGRPNFFLDEEEKKIALGLEQSSGNVPYNHAVSLNPFDLTQIKEALRGMPQTVKEEICTLAENDTKFLKLISRPSILYICSILWEKEKLQEKASQLNSAHIIGLFTKYSYRRQGSKEKGPREFTELTSLEREFFMKGVAAYMVANRLPNQIKGSTLNAAVDSLINGIPESVSTKTPATYLESTVPLLQRMENKENARDIVKQDVRTCAILVDDPSSASTFRFGHKSFMEYLFAELLAEYLLKDTDASSAILNVTKCSIDHLIDLPESLDLLCELVKNFSVSKIGIEKKNISPKTSSQHDISMYLLKRILGSDNVLVLATMRWFFLKVSPVFSPRLISSILYDIYSINVKWGKMVLTENGIIVNSIDNNNLTLRSSLARKMFIWSYICEKAEIETGELKKIVSKTILRNLEKRSKTMIDKGIMPTRLRIESLRGRNKEHKNNIG